MSIEKKIKEIAKTLTMKRKKQIVNYNPLHGSYNSVNAEISKTDTPICAIITQNDGTANLDNSHYRDGEKLLIMLLNNQELDFKGWETDRIKEFQKKKMFELVEKIRRDDGLTLNNTDLQYTVSYNQFDDALCGILFELNISVYKGEDLACKIYT